MINNLTKKFTGEPILAALKDEWLFGVGSMIFLAIFFCPRDLVYKLVQLKLVTFVICIYNEILRANKIYKGLEEGKSAMPAEGSVFFIPVLIAILKVNSYPIFRKFLKIKTKINFDNFFSGQWIYTCHSNHSIDQRR